MTQNEFCFSVVYQNNVVDDNKAMSKKERKEGAGVVRTEYIEYVTVKNLKCFARKPLLCAYWLLVAKREGAHVNVAFFLANHATIKPFGCQ